MFKYNCDQCKYYTNYKSKWFEHTSTTKHKTGKRKVRSDKKIPIPCDKCDHISKTCYIAKLHKLNNHSTLDERKEGFKYYCEVCDYGTFLPSSYKRHSESKKHKHIINILNKN